LKRLVPAVVCLVTTLCLTNGCSSHRLQPVGTQGMSSLDGDPSAASADTADFDRALASHLSLPPRERARRREAADAHAERWRDFEREVVRHWDLRYRRWTIREQPQQLYRMGSGVTHAITDLAAATRLDPSFAEAWAGLGRLCMEVGDLPSARQYLDNALAAAAAEAATGRPLDDATLLGVHRDRAWVLRDLARWEEGLAAVHAGLTLHPGDRDLVLVKGLLLAGAGRYTEATTLAVRMEPIGYPRLDFIFRGFSTQKSSYANNWIRSQALLANGEEEMALHVLGDLETLAYRGLLPHAARFWRDAGLVAELNRHPRAPIYYSVGYVTRNYLAYYPLSAHNVTPQVLDMPDPVMPAFASYGQRYYVGGSPLTYAAGQLNLMTLAAFPQQRAAAAARALHTLDIMERRRVRPDFCKALRGRVLFAEERYAPARAELADARDLFAADGTVEPVTSMLLGLLAMREEDWVRAEKMLAESAAAGPDNAIAWRSLGVARSKQGHFAAAEDAMDRAIALEPYLLSGYYNRGLLHMQQQDFGAAVADLETAFRLDPDNREVQRLLQMAAASQRANGQTVARSQGPPPGFDPDPEFLRAEMEAQLDAMFSLPDSLRDPDLDMAGQIRNLGEQYRLTGDPGVRMVLALAYLDQKRHADVQDLLAPFWGVDLAPSEEVMLLYADRRLGERSRAAEVAASVLRAPAGQGNPYLWTLAATLLREDTNPEAYNQNPFTGHGFFSMMMYGTATGRRTDIFEEMRRSWHALGASFPDVDPNFTARYDRSRRRTHEMADPCGGDARDSARK
jgi:tetratricopeptide (TPR) repeat protein